jgi:hypothetical protein
MKPFCVFVTKLILFLLLVTNAKAQEPPDSVMQISTRYVDAVSVKAQRIENKLNAKTLKTLARFGSNQRKLRSKLIKVDSAEATRIFDRTTGELATLQNRLQQRVQSTQYIPFLDTIKTSLRFLAGQKGFLSKAKNPGDKISDGLSKVNNLEQQFQKAEEVKKVLRQQKEFLENELQKFGFAKDLKRLNKQAYYYSAQIKEYKEAIKDKKKLERKAVGLLSKAKPFQEFMKKNSMLASLFRMPVDDPSDPFYLQSLSGLQTRVQIDQLIQQQIAAGGPGVINGDTSPVKAGNATGAWICIGAETNHFG